MVNITCINTDCKYNINIDLQCGKDQIVINSDVVCDDFEFKKFPVFEEVEDDQRD